MHQDRLMTGMVGMATVALAAQAMGTMTMAEMDDRLVSRSPVRLLDHRHESREKSSGLARMLKKSKRQ